MPLGNKKRYPNTVARRKISGVGAEAQRPTQTPILITDTVPGDTTTVTFNGAVFLTGIPQWPNNSGHVPEAAVMTSPTVLTLTYPTADTTTSITVPFQEPAIRNTGGGYVVPGTFS
jgi:hypothetical protein